MLSWTTYIAAVTILVFIYRQGFMWKSDSPEYGSLSFGVYPAGAGTGPTFNVRYEQTEWNNPQNIRIGEDTAAGIGEDAVPGSDAGVYGRYTGKRVVRTPG
jgi:hypothetical protein